MEEIKIGSVIQIIKNGCNNTNKRPDHLSALESSKILYTVEDIRKDGLYWAKSLKTHTLILNTGHPVWASHCKLAIRPIINNYEIY